MDRIGRPAQTEEKGKRRLVFRVTHKARSPAGWIAVRALVEVKRC